VESIDREGRTVVLKFRPQARVDPVRLVALVRQRPDLTLIPPAGLKLSLDGARDSALGARGTEPKPREKSVPRPETRIPSHGKGGQKLQAASPSWWTARARTGEVTPGFTKAEILKPAKDDPRAPGGVFERVGQLLSELLGEM
jgi:hypothetical protein